MVALLILLGSLTTGWAITRFFRLVLYKVEFLALAAVIGLMVSTWLFFLAIFALGYSNGIFVGLAMQITTTIVGWYYHQKQLFPKWLPLTTAEKRLGAASIVLWLIFTGYLFSTHFFLPKAGGLDSAGSTWGDLGLHSTLINYFAQQQTPSLDSPVYARENLTYPFLLDFYTALLVRTGLSVRDSLLATSLYLSFCIGALFYFCLKRILKSPWVAASGSFLFFLNSSTGLYYLFQEWQSSGISLWNFLRNLPEGYVHYHQVNLDWPQFMYDYFLPQRGILAGFAVFLTVCILVHSYLYPGKKAAISTSIYSVSIFIAILLGLLPLFHIHTFFTLVLVVGWCLMVGWYSKKISFKKLIPAFGVLAVLSVPQLWWQFSQTFHTGFVSLHLGWLSDKSTRIHFQPMVWLWYWVRNLGLEFFLTLVGVYFLQKKEPRNSFLVLLAVPLTALFLICNLFSLQPSIWDNSKFLFYSHFLFICLSLYGLLHLPLAKGKRIIVISVALFLLLSGGLIATLRESQMHWQLASSDEIAVAQQLQKMTPPNAIILTGGSHNHPVTMLAGRPTLVGYRGWLWTYGIDFAGTDRELYEMYAGDQNSLGLLHDYHISYVYIGQLELNEFSANENYFRAHFPAIIDTPTARVYAVQ